jgi:RNA polymerase-binding transcription factor DksA
MLPERNIHDRLVTGALQLDRCLQHLESELEHPRSPICSGAATRQSTPALTDLIQTTRRELGRVESSLQRVATGEFGVCASCGTHVSTDRLELLPHTMLCEACAPPLEGDPLERVRSEHVGLRRLVRSLQKFVERAADHDSGEREQAGAYRAALVLLGDLERELGKHFALEDLGGYLSAALAAAPHLSRKAAVLEGQHARFQEQVAKIVEQARSTGPGSAGWDAIDCDFQSFAAALLEHEQQEDGIIADSFLQDCGGGG